MIEDEEPMQPAIDISNLEFSVRRHAGGGPLATGGGYRTIIRVPDLHIQRESIVTILGPSGCGKTTLLKLIAGLHDSHEKNAHLTGRIRVADRCVAEAVKLGLVSISFQTPVVMRWRTAYDNVTLPLELAGRFVKSTADQRICNSLKMVKLDHASGWYPEALSSGMLSRVAVAQAMVCGAKILLMDEVFGTLDEANRVSMNLMLRDMNCRFMHSTILFVTHSIEEALLLGDRVLVFRDLLGQSDKVAPSIVADIVPRLESRTRAITYSTEFLDQKSVIDEILLALTAAEDRV
jgi:NitT/TauT family transport system ATP-binding protein